MPLNNKNIWLAECSKIYISYFPEAENDKYMQNVYSEKFLKSPIKL